MPRRNPMTKFSEFAFVQQDPLYLGEMKRSKKKYGFEKAALALSEWTGRGHEEIRSEGLRIVAAYVQHTFKSATDALRWLTLQNRRLGLWCACAVAREGLPYVGKYGRSSAMMISYAEDWVRGKRDASSVRELTRKIANSVTISRANTYMSAVSICLTGGMLDSRLRDASESMATCANQIAEIKVFESISADENTTNAQEDRKLVSVVVDAIMTFPEKRA